MTIRLRRLRSHDAMRRLIRETSLSPAHLVAPIFVSLDAGTPRDIKGMPSCQVVSPDQAARLAHTLDGRGVAAVLLFGVTSRKDATGTSASDPDGAVARGIAAIRAAAPRMSIWTDVCLCAYTSHGHCGVLTHDRRGVCTVDNEATLPRLAETAVAYAAAGADAVAPSDMMDGRVRAIRQALDASGHHDTAIASYAVKFASAFYGPFRHAAGSAPADGDRRSYQMDPGNAREAVREARADVREGADLVIVKPALAYGDVIHSVRQSIHAPIVAYHVSGEFAMIKAAAGNGWIDERAVVLETLMASRRAGASAIITYFADTAADWLS